MSTFRTFGETTDLDYESKTPRPRYNARGRAVAAIAGVLLVLAFLVGLVSEIGWPDWPVRDASERIAYGALGVLILGIAVEFLPSCWTRLPANIAAVLVAIVPTMLPMVRPNDWTMTQLTLIAAGIALGVGMLATSTARLAARENNLLIPLVITGMNAATAGLILMTGSLKFGRIGFWLAGGAAATVVVSLFAASFRKSAAAVTVSFAILAGSMMAAHLWSSFVAWYAIAIFAAPIIAWLAAVKFVARWPAWRRVIVVLLLAAAPAAAVCGVAAAKAYQDAQNDSADGYGGY
jgi:hypothetical protein